jgi:cytochrome c biogenesis protein CcmG/thiol:disulfide interchange protein DsbE
MRTRKLRRRELTVGAIGVTLWSSLGLALISCQGAPPAPPPTAPVAHTLPPWAKPETPPAPADRGTEAGPVMDEPAEPVTRPRWIGVWFQKDTSKIRQVIPSSPAEKAGLLAGDEITTFNGEHVSKARDVIDHVGSVATGTTVTVGVKRGAKMLDVPVTVGLRPDLQQLSRNALIDKPAPDFTLPTIDGTTVKLAELRGHLVVLDFWATWCGPCIAAAPMLVKAAKKYPEIRIVGISADDLDDIKKFANDHAITYTLARDEQQELWRDYFVRGLPTTIVIDAQGIVRNIEYGFGGSKDLEDAIRAVNSRQRSSP